MVVSEGGGVLERRREMREGDILTWSVESG
jgi:hypothetical protein